MKGDTASGDDSPHGGAKPPASMEMASRMRRLKAEGKDVVDLTWGAPHVPPDAKLLQAAAEHLSNGAGHSYGPSRGEMALRRAIAEDLDRRRGLHFDPESEILIVPGGKMGVYSMLSALVPPDAEVLLPEPFWLTYPAALNMCHCRPIPVPSQAKNRFVACADDLVARVSPRTAGVILNSPNNPSGTVYSQAEIDAWKPALQDMEFILCDEVYEQILFDGRTFASPVYDPDLRERCIVLNSFSKSLAVPGWRLGYLAARGDWIDRIHVFQQQTATCMPSFLQLAIADQLSACDAFVDSMNQQYALLRDLFCEGIDGKNGFHVLRPEGGFYALLRSDWVSRGDVLAGRLVDECGIGVVPGSAYGSSTEGWVRVCFARPEDRLLEAVARLGAWAA